MRVHLAYRERGLDIDVPATATVIEPLRELATHERLTLVAGDGASWLLG